ncbi:MAG: nicotinate-nucleotide adenylyltransferase [bacterium]
MQERIGIFGGTFNPVHLGHLVMAQDAFEQFSLSRVLFLPASTPPHKAGPHVASAEHRLAMLRLAVEPDPRFEVCEEEIRRSGVSYTIDTIRHLKEHDPGAALFFIIGSDTLRELHTWKDIHTLLELCDFVTLARPGFAVDNLTSAQLRIKDPWPERLARNVILGHLVELSSTDIRIAAEHGRSIRYLVPEPVERYIRDTRLYQSQEIPR